jgi:L-fuconolactonase
VLFDSHCHAWTLWPYDTAVPDPTSRGSAEALLWEMDAHGVERAAIVCARIGGGAGGNGFANDDNNAYVARFAETHPDRITSWVDVDSFWRSEHHSEGATERLLQEVDRTGVSGFTHYVDARNDGWLRTEDAARFFRAAADTGLIASLAVTAAWFDDLRMIAVANPTLPLLIHHLSHPQTPGDVDALIALADLSNVGVKVSGFNYNSPEKWNFPYPASQALFRTIHGAFGAKRLYWGSDFPASRDQLTYRQSIEVLRSHATFLTQVELDDILGDNLSRLVAHPRLS